MTKEKRYSALLKLMRLALFAKLNCVSLLILLGRKVEVLVIFGI